MAEGWQWDGRDDEPPGGPAHRAADAADLLTLKAFRGFLPPEVFRQVAGLTGAMIAQRHAGDDDMVAFLRESMKVLMRDGMSGSGSARTAVVIPPSPYVGGFAFNASAVDSVRGSAEDIASAVVLQEAPVPSRLERSAISPTADLPRDERTEFSLIDALVRWLCWLLWQWRSLSRVLIRRRRAVSFIPALIHRCCDAAEVGVACTGLSLMACVGCAKCACEIGFFMKC